MGGNPKNGASPTLYRSWKHLREIAQIRHSCRNPPFAVFQQKKKPYTFKDIKETLGIPTIDEQGA